MGLTAKDLIKKVKSATLDKTDLDERISSKYNQVNQGYQRANTIPNVRQMYNRLPQTLQPARQTYNAINRITPSQVYRTAQTPLRLNPVTALPTAIANRYQKPIMDYARLIPRGVAEAGLTVNEVVGGKRVSVTPQSLGGSNPFARIALRSVLGTNPLKSHLEQAETGGVDTLSSLGVNNPQKFVPAMAFAGFALDATPPGFDDLVKGGGKKLIPRVAKVAGKTNDVSDITRLKNSIAEGENILRAKSFNGRKLSNDELGAVARSIENTKAKIGWQTISYPNSPLKYKIQELSSDELLNFGETGVSKEYIEKFNNKNILKNWNRAVKNGTAELRDGKFYKIKSKPKPPTDPLSSLKQEAITPYDVVVRPSGQSTSSNVSSGFKYFDSLPKEPIGKHKTVKIIGLNPSANDHTLRTNSGNFQRRSSQTSFKQVPIKVVTRQVAGRKMYEVTDKTGEVLDTYYGELPKDEVISILRNKGAKFLNEPVLNQSTTPKVKLEAKVPKAQQFLNKVAEHNQKVAKIKPEDRFLADDDLLDQSTPKLETNQTVKQIPQVLPKTQMEMPQTPVASVNNLPPSLLQAPQAKQLLPEKIKLESQPLKTQQPAQDSSLDDIIAEGRKQIGTSKAEPRTSVRKMASDSYTQWVDRYHPLVKASQQAKKTLSVKGAELRPEYDPEYLVRRLTGAGGIADYRFNTELKPVLDQIDKAKIEKVDIDTYLANRRIAGFGKVNRDVYGADPVKAQQIVSALETKYGDQIKQVADQLYTYQNKGFQELVDAGFISPDAAKAMKGENPDYAPLYRVMDEVNDYLGLPTRKTMQSSQPVKKLKGSTRQIESPLESIIGNTFSQRAALERNRVARSLVDLQEVADMGFKKVSKSSGDTITVWRDGKKEFWQVGSDIADVAKGVNEEVTNTLLKIIQAPAQLLRQGATGRNPDFMIPNIVRDQLDAGITSRYGYIPFVDYVSGLRSMLKNDDVYKKWQQSGAKIDLGELSGKKSISKLFDEKTSKKRLSSWLIDALDVMGKYSEQPTRVGLFKKAYKKTGNELLSALESRDATVDFARMGSKMKVANSIIPFLNVGVQGFDKLIRAVKNNPTKVMVNLGLYAATPAAITTLYNLTTDPEAYAEIPQYERDSNFVLVTGRNPDGTVKYLTFPKGNVVPIASNPITSMIEFMYGEDKQSFGELATSLLSQTLPVVGDGQSLKEVAVKTIGSNLPQAIKPITENLINKSFYKYDTKKEDTKEIVPYYLKDKPAYEQKYEWTPQMYQKIGAVLNVSPLQVQNLMEGYLAGYAKIPAMAVENLYKISNGQPISPNETLIVRRFVKSTYPTSGTKKVEKEVTTPSFMQRVTGQASANEKEFTAIPTNQDDFNELYKQAKSKGTGFPQAKMLIDNDPTLTDSEKAEKIAKLKEKTADWAELNVIMEDKYPEKVFTAQLSTYGKNSSFTVEQRAEWVNSKLNAVKDEKQLQDWINQMWDTGVLTTGSSGTAELLKDQYDLDLYTYTGSSKKIRDKVSKAKKGKKVTLGKAPQIKKISFTPTRSKISIQSKQPTKLNLKSLSMPRSKKKPSINLMKASDTLTKRKSQGILATRY